MSLLNNTFNDTMDNTTERVCNSGLFLPIIPGEENWDNVVRAGLYFAGLIYCFMGVAIVADIFMGAIEKITSTTKRLYLSTAKEGETEIVEVRIWNDTVANLTLMAMGSSAPEILLSVIETVGKNFEAGDLGPGTIVGSAAFNLLGITAVCVMCIPKGESRPIKMFKVFLVTTTFSLVAYIWMLVVLQGISPNVVELWEAIATFILFPVLVAVAFVVDKDMCNWKKNSVVSETDKQIELGNFQPAEKMLKERKFFRNGKLDRDALLEFYREIRRFEGLTDEDAAILAASKLTDSQEHSRMWYRIGAVRNLTGSRRVQPVLNKRLKQVYEVINAHPEAPNLGPVPEPDTFSSAVIEFHAARCAVPENIGKFNITVVRHGRMNCSARVRVETIDGLATANEDYVPINKVIVFEPNESEKIVQVEIVDDNQWEPDEEFFLRLTPMRRNGEEAVVLGRLAIMEITILNDDNPGVLSFTKRGVLIKESIGILQVVVLRAAGSDGVVSVKWRTNDKTALNKKDFIGGEGELEFNHHETERVIDIPIIDDMEAEKDECFEVELYDPQGGAQIGKINRIAITISNDDAFDSVLDRIQSLTHASMTSMRVHHDTWGSQMKDALTVNGGDIENAAASDYIMHALTVFWKCIFSFIPPPSILGGWLCFFVSLAVIGLLTAVIGDLAGIFGCLVGLKDSVTAITFVALGTSLPDLFASMTAAKQERYADNAIGNVTGSNSVNVFFGLGLPWVMATIYHASKGTVYKVPAGAIGFSVLMYSGVAVLAVALFLCRRYMGFFGKAELGGPTIPKIISGVFLISLWFFYVLMSSLQAYGHI